MINPRQLHFIRANLLRLLSVSIVMVITTGRALAEFSEEVVEQAKASTVLIVREDGGRGSGFVINARGHVATNHHVVEGSNKLECIFLLGNTLHVREAKVVCRKPESDLAIIKVERFPAARPMTIASYKPATSQEVMALGFPAGLFQDPQAFYGGLDADGNKRVSGKARDECAPVTFNGNIGQLSQHPSGYGGDFDAITHSAKISSGNSGGPLIGVGGNVLGVNVQVFRTPGAIKVNYSFAIRASELVEFAGDHGIPIKTEADKPSGTGTLALTGGPKDHLSKVLLVSIALLVVVLFILVLRKPRMVLVDSVSKLVHSRRSAPNPAPRHAPHQAAPPAPNPSPVPVPAVSGQGTMRLRGRDPQGISYDLTFNDSDFRRSGGRLVIGRNNDLSQLPLSQDSISRQHATLIFAGGTVQVEDRNSGNGTMVNGRDLVVGQPAVTLQPGDKLTLGEVDLMFEILN